MMVTFGIVSSVYGTTAFSRNNTVMLTSSTLNKVFCCFTNCISVTKQIRPHLQGAPKKRNALQQYYLLGGSKGLKFSALIYIIIINIKLIAKSV